MSLQAIDSLTHYAGKANELQALRDRVAELEDVLGISFEQRNPFFRLRLTPQQTAIAGLLYRSQMVRKGAAYSAIYGARLECDQPDPKILDIQICRLRAALARVGVSVETQRGIGWFITAENKEKLRLFIEGNSIVTKR